jgi:hypothetical protein
LLKVALNTINLNLNHLIFQSSYIWDNLGKGNSHKERQ